uniref:Uncharacterized protein n=1 Tax=Scleropages formosus TaxID=113540 RepID=A0A8C9QTQ5_SCLFO
MGGKPLPKNTNQDLVGVILAKGHCDTAELHSYHFGEGHSPVGASIVIPLFDGKGHQACQVATCGRDCVCASPLEVIIVPIESVVMRVTRGPAGACVLRETNRLIVLDHACFLDPACHTCTSECIPISTSAIFQAAATTIFY